MKQRSHTTGTIQGEILIYQQGEEEVTIAVGSTAWFAWLERATSFTFRNEEGHFTAHKTHAGNRRGGYYWRATRRSRGRLYSFYLGTSERLTLQRLQEAARDLAAYASNATPSEAISAPVDIPDANADNPLLATKLHIPRLPMQHVSRPRLLALLEQGVQRPLTLVAAPAGSGKTTLLAEWASTTAIPVSWLSLEVAENDPARFLSYLIAALADLDGYSGITIRQKYGSALPLSWEQVMTSLINDLTELLQRDAVMILDDCHLLANEEVHAILQFLLDHLPLRLHLVIGTRSDPPLPLARLRARNQVSELRTEELCFVSAEVEEFTKAMGQVLSGEATSLLQQRTEGWIAGVQLLMLALRGHTDAEVFLKASGGTHRFLLDYVSEEILVQQTPEIQRFLLHTCILDRLSGPLCDAVTGETGGQAQLTVILRANLFLSELDDTQTWYRYHALFAESLRTHLLKQAPEQLPELYRRASHWYEQQHWNEEACEYAFLAGDHSRAAVLLEKLLPRLIGRGKFLRLSQWFSQLPPAATASSPLLYIASIIGAQMQRKPSTGNTYQTVKMLIEHLEQQIQQHTQDTASRWVDLQAGLPLLKALTALSEGDLVRTISLAQEISPTPSHPESVLNQFIVVGRRMLLSAAYGASGNLASAEHILLEASTSHDSSISFPFNLSAILNLAELYETQGQLRKLGQAYDNLFQALDRDSDPSPLFHTLALVRYAALLYEWNRLGEAEATVQQGLEMGQRLDLTIPGVLIFSIGTQVRIALVQGYDERARHLLEQHESDLVQWQLPEQSIGSQGALPARLALACGLLEKAERWEKTRGLRFDDELSPQLPSRDYFDYVTLARILLARGRSQHAQPALSQTLNLLNHLHSAVTSTGAHGYCMEIQMLAALTLQAQGKSKRALSTLGPVLAQAEPEGYVRLFADEGEAMAHLLAQIAAYTTASPGYIEQLQAAIIPTQNNPHASTQAASQQPLLDPLSTREREVLSLLAQGFSNQQIAEHLVISLNTAKRHVKHILAKLTVTNRTQAVTRARELDLL